MTFRRRTARLRTSAVTALITASVVALTGCAATPAEQDSETPTSFGDIDVQLSWILNEEWAGEMIAQESGYYTDAGFDSVTLIGGPSSGVAELLGGGADISLTDALSVGAAVAEVGAPIKVLGSTFQKNPFTILSVTDPITTPEDMIGKRIGVQAANSAVFEAFLTANGIDSDQVEVVPVEYDPSVLVNGEVDGLIAFVTSQSVTLSNQGIPVTNLLFADNGMPFVAHVVTATDESIADNREMLKAFLAAEIRGWSDAVADPAAGAQVALDLHGADLGLDLETSTASAVAQAELLIVSDETAENGLFTISDELQEQTLESLASAGIDLEAADLFDLSLLAEVYDENPDLVDYSK